MSPSPPRLTRQEMRLMVVLWDQGPSSVREVQTALPAKGRPAYTTVQTVLSRLEAKKAVRRLKKVGNAVVFEASVSRTSAERRLVDELLALVGGRAQLVVAHLIEGGRLSLADVRDAEQLLRKLQKEEE